MHDEIEQVPPARLGSAKVAIIAGNARREAHLDRLIDLGLAYTEGCLQISDGIWVIALRL